LTINDQIPFVHWHHDRQRRTERCGNPWALYNQHDEFLTFVQMIIIISIINYYLFSLSPKASIDLISNKRRFFTIFWILFSDSLSSATETTEADGNAVNAPSSATGKLRINRLHSWCDECGPGA
jgi:hypothetical protein